MFENTYATGSYQQVGPDGTTASAGARRAFSAHSHLGTSAALAAFALTSGAASLTVSARLRDAAIQASSVGEPLTAGRLLSALGPVDALLALASAALLLGLARLERRERRLTSLLLHASPMQALAALAEATGIPVGQSQAGKGTLVYDHPQCLGAIGSTGTTAANAVARDADVVRSAVAQGAVQYVLKPFTFAGLRDKLERYADYRAATGADGPAAQGDIDRALSVLRGSDRALLPKGLSEDTLATVVAGLRAGREPLSATDLATRLGVSRATARRYLEHLADAGLAVRALRYGVGRPEHVYRWG